MGQEALSLRYIARCIIENWVETRRMQYTIETHPREFWCIPIPVVLSPEDQQSVKDHYRGERWGFVSVDLDSAYYGPGFSVVTLVGRGPATKPDL